MALPALLLALGSVRLAPAVSPARAHTLPPHARSPSLSASAAGPQPQSAIVVGGGVAGLSCAIELAQRGWSVRVLSRSQAESATLAAGGMLAPQAERLRSGPLLDLCLEARTYFPKWVDGIQSLAGESAELLAPGGFIAPAFAGDAVDTWTPPAGSGSAIRLDAAAARDSEPALASDVSGGFVFPQEASVDPRKLQAALLSAAAAVGVQVIEGAEANGLQLAADGETVEAVTLREGGSLRASQVVLCAGSWLSQLAPLPCAPLKGQSLALRPPAGALPLQRVIFAERCYLIPRADGR